MQLFNVNPIPSESAEWIQKIRELKLKKVEESIDLLNALIQSYLSHHK